MLKVVDIFAGPGGLSEGFAAVTEKNGKPVFEMVLSIEKDEQAHATLLLRTFFREFGDSVPNDYYCLLRGEIDRRALFDSHPAEAKRAENRSWHATLGAQGVDGATVRDRIAKALGTSTSWVLIGGPPCQAYSTAGRSRNRGNPDYDPAKDERQRLYVEYLQILAEHRPAVFIMENVKGLLSASLENERMFNRILEDLREPAKAIKREGRNAGNVQKGGYRIHALTGNYIFENGELRGSVVAAEKYGIPQARHRIILLGIRDDVSGAKPRILAEQKAIPASSVLGSLPELRSGLSPLRKDSAAAWRSYLRSQMECRWANAGTRKASGEELAHFIREKLTEVSIPRADRGAEFLEVDATPTYAIDWFVDNRLKGVINHTSRSHMPKDLCRYFYAACYAKHHGRTPTLSHFPADLLPNHVSINDAFENGGHFSDRFRVQIASKPSTTIVSHISKDGHYYIHPDPLQCRSLTVREAARLQTFPDNYFFCGNRTAQYASRERSSAPPCTANRRDCVRSAESRRSERLMDRLTREHRSWNMSRVSGRNTRPELFVRSVLHCLGYRFRLHVSGLPGRPDIVLPRHRTVVLVHGCFWHRHTGCRFAYQPKSNVAFWSDKFDQNVRRDSKNKRDLRRLGWHVVVVWECQTSDRTALKQRLTTELNAKLVIPAVGTKQADNN